MPRQQTPAQRETVQRVMHEYKHGELKTARGTRKVKNPKQAIAIALHEAGASKNESPAENKRNLRRTKAKERRGETYQDEAEGRKSGAARKSAATRKRTTAKAKSSTSRSSAARSAKGKTRTTAAKGRTRAASAKTRSTARVTTARRTTRATASRSASRTASARRSSRATSARSRTTRRASGNRMTRAELYAEARRRDIPGRSKMNKRQLERALHR